MNLLLHYHHCLSELLSRRRKDGREWRGAAGGADEEVRTRRRGAQTRTSFPASPHSSPQSRTLRVYLVDQAEVSSTVKHEIDQPVWRLSPRPARLGWPKAGAFPGQQPRPRSLARFGPLPPLQNSPPLDGKFHLPVLQPLKLGSWRLRQRTVPGQAPSGQAQA